MYGGNRLSLLNWATWAAVVVLDIIRSCSDGKHELAAVPKIIDLRGDHSSHEYTASGFEFAVILFK